MKAKKINHVAIIIPDLDEARHFYGEVLGLPFDHEESSDVWNVTALFYWCGDVLLELLYPTGPGVDMDFLNESGGGIHHIAYEVDDIEEAFASMKDTYGTQTDEILPGASDSRIFFLKTENVGNVETELVQSASISTHQ